MYHDLLNSIRERSALHGEQLQPPCSLGALENLRVRARQELDYELPIEYAEFLSVTNGLDWNGLVVYASERSSIVGFSDRLIEGFVEGNLNYRDYEAMKDYVVFAEDGVVLFTHCLSQSEFQVITTVGLSVIERFSRFSELLANAFQGHV